MRAKVGWEVRHSSAGSHRSSMHWIAAFVHSSIVEMNEPVLNFSRYGIDFHFDSIPKN